MKNELPRGFSKDYDAGWCGREKFLPVIEREMRLWRILLVVLVACLEHKHVKWLFPTLVLSIQLYYLPTG